jgi:hypothetical protein
MPTGFKHDPQVKKWIKRLTGDPEALPGDLNEQQLQYVYAEVLKRRPDFEPTLFAEAMQKTVPILAAPKITNVVADTETVFSQPEMLEFWRSWQGPQHEKGSDINYSGAKALAFTIGFKGTSAHFEEAHENLEANAKLQAVFDRVEAAISISGVLGSFRLPPYSSAMRHVNSAGPACWLEAMKANIEMVKEIRKLNPGKGVGERLLIDGCPIAAWVQQKSGRKDPEREAALRKRAPEAGFRMYTFSKSAKGDIDPTQALKPALEGGLSKAWRGYLLVVIADQATGLPLVWTVIDAATDEAAAIVGLLSDLYRLWPDCPAICIAGDSAYDEDPWCRLAEVEYGLAPIFRLHPSHHNSPRPTFKNGESRDGSVLKISGEGHLYCARHGKPLAYDTVDRPPRRQKNGTPLRPGQTSAENEFRIRAICSHDEPGKPPCGKLGLRAQINWSALTRIPHHALGRPKLYAFRQAMLVRLNGVEGIFNRLKSRNLGTQGAGRPRVVNKETVEALLSVSLLSMTALTLADQRAQHGITHTLPSPTTAPAATSGAPAAPPATGPSTVGGPSSAAPTSAGQPPAGRTSRTAPTDQRAPARVRRNPAQRVLVAHLARKQSSAA